MCQVVRNRRLQVETVACAHTGGQICVSVPVGDWNFTSIADSKTSKLLIALNRKVWALSTQSVSV